MKQKAEKNMTDEENLELPRSALLIFIEILRGSSEIM